MIYQVKKQHDFNGDAEGAVADAQEDGQREKGQARLGQVWLDRFGLCVCHTKNLVLK